MGLLIKLQNGDTALKSLKFGKDKPGGGDSGQPYIKDPLLDNPLPESKDFLLRGGLNAPIDAAQDVIRLTKYMFDLKSPSGLLFIAKQNLLSRLAPKTQASTGAAYAGGAINNGIYTPLSTLAQAGVGFLGVHLNKQGIDPTGLIPGISIKKYEDVVTFSQPANDNRLVNLSLYSTTLDGIGINQGQDVLTYGGGPGSILGVGKTHIRYADQRTGVNNPLSDSDPKYFYNGGIVRPNSDVIIYNNKVTYGLGASKKEGLDDSQIGITEEGIYDPSTLTGNPYNYTLPYSTLSKNSLGLTLSGSGGYHIGLVRPLELNLSNNLGASKLQPIPEGSLFPEYVTYGSGSNTTLGKNLVLDVEGSNYQVGNNRKYQTQESDTTYKSQIEGKLVELGRELLSDSVFIPGNTWRGTSSGPGGIIQEYSSKNSLIVDITASKETNDKEKFDIINQPKTEGYLANLDKNSGVAFINGVYKRWNNITNEGFGRGIARDFRRVTRKKRGFDDYPDNYDIITNPTSSWENTVDKIYYSSSSKRKSNELDGTDDLITFRFDIINPTNPNATPKSLNFRAYINTFTDSYNSEWKSQTYMGRAEKFYKYDSFGRSISLGFTIVADNPTNLDIMYNQLNTLAASLAPTYTTYGYMAGNLHKLTVGNYINNQVGIMDGLTYEVIEESPWEIDSENQLPMYIRVTGIKFTPIHNFRPESQFNDTHQYINQHPTKQTPKKGDTPVGQFNPRTPLQEVTVTGRRNG